MTTGPEEQRSRRSIIGAGAAAAAAATIGAMAAGGSREAVAAVSDPFIRLSDYSAVGDGTTNDTTAVQNAINAAPAGSTVIGDYGKTYLINGTLSFPNDDVTLDLNRAGLKAGSSGGTVLQISGRTGVRVTNGKLTSAAGAGTTSARVTVTNGSACSIDHLDATCAGAAFVAVSGGSAHVVEDNYVSAGSVSVATSPQTAVRSNTIDAPPSSKDGILVSDATDVRVEANVIGSYAKAAIKVSSTGSADLTSGVFVTLNRVLAPASGSTGPGISVFASGALVEGNDIVDAPDVSIKATGSGSRVFANRIRYSSSSLSAKGIVIDASEGSATGATVQANTIHQATVGVDATPTNPPLHSVTICDNLITDSRTTGIEASGSGATDPEGMVIAGNVVRFSQAGPSAATRRIGIRAGYRANLSANRVVYKSFTLPSGFTELAIAIRGDDVVLSANVVDGQGISVSCGSDGALYSRSVWLANSFLRSASLDLSQLAAAVVRDNRGTITGTRASTIAAVPAGAPTPTISGGDRTGSIGFGSGPAPGAGNQVTISFADTLDVTPAVTITPTNAATAGLGLYVASVTTTGFTVGSSVAPAASQPASAYLVTYVVRRPS